MNFIEPRQGREASEYIENNYETVLNYAEYLLHGDTDRAQDLIQDVWAGLKKRENQGDGFDPNFGDNKQTVNQFVFGVIKLYSKNKIYKKSQWLSLDTTDTKEKEDNTIKDNRIDLSDVSLEDRLTSLVDLDRNLRMCTSCTYNTSISILGVLRDPDVLLTNRSARKSGLIRDFLDQLKLNSETFEAFVEIYKCYKMFPSEYSEAVDKFIAASLGDIDTD